MNANGRELISTDEEFVIVGAVMEIRNLPVERLLS
jgi:hypothetical protein